METAAMPTPAEIERRIKQVLITDLEIDPARVTSTSAGTPLLGRGIGIDSVETLALVAGIEREFDICVDDADLTPELFATIGSLSEYVARKQGERSEEPAA